MSVVQLNCHYPSMHYVINPEGSVRPCCVSDINDDPSFNVHLKKNVLLDDSFQKIRDDFQNNKWPKICTQCKIKEENNIQSHRQLIEKKFCSSEVKLKYLDVKFSNVCNLACIMCNPLNSSQLERAYDNFPNLRPNFIEKKIIKITQNFNIVSHVKDAISNGLEILKVTGGEPFVSKEFFETIDFCIKNDHAKNIELKFTTNATKINFKILKKLEKFKKLDITVSVDGCNKIYEYIRYGANWKKFFHNVSELEKISKIKFNAVLTSYNVLNLNELIEIFDNRIYIDTGLKPNDSELNAKFLPNFIKEIAIDRVNHPNIKTFLLTNNFDEKKCFQLKQTTLKYDQLRNRNYQNYLDPILIKYLNSI